MDMNEDEQSKEEIDDKVVITNFKAALSAAVQRRVADAKTVGILFSGGVDSLLLTVLAAQLLPNDHLIDLINVAFGEDESASFSVPDRGTGLRAYRCLQELFPKRTWRFVMVNVTKNELQRVRQQRIGRLIRPADTVLDDSIGCVLW